MDEEQTTAKSDDQATRCCQQDHPNTEVFYLKIGISQPVTQHQVACKPCKIMHVDSRVKMLQVRLRDQHNYEPNDQEITDFLFGGVAYKLAYNRYKKIQPDEHIHIPQVIGATVPKLF